MFERTAMNSEFCDVEEMVRAAGNYLDVTDDLRAHTLDKAHYGIRKTSIRFRIIILAVVVVFLAMSASTIRGRLSSTLPLMAGVSADGDQPYGATRQKTAPTRVDPSGSLVDAFSELRHRQAKVIKDAF